MNTSQSPFWIKFLPEYVKSYFLSDLSQKVADNVLWLSLDKVIRILGELVVGIWIARYLGAELFGVLSYALAYSIIFTVISYAGLDRILVREFVREEKKSDIIISSGIIIRLIISIIITIIAILSAYFIKSGDNLTLYAIIIMVIGIVFRATDPIKFWFEANLESKYYVISENIAYISMSLLRVLLILLSADLIYFAISYLLEAILMGIGYLLNYKLYTKSFINLRISKEWISKIFKAGFPLALASINIIIYNRIDIIMLGEMVGKYETGIYSAGIKLSEAWYFVPGILIPSYFPAILKLREIKPQLYLKRLKQLYVLLIIISILIAIPVSIFSPLIISIFFGNEYMAGSTILAIHIWSMTASFLGTATNQYLIAENMQNISLYRTVIGVVVNVILNFILIPLYGAIGAAVASLISYYFSTFSMFFFAGSREHSKILLSSFDIFSWYKLLKK